MHLPKLIKFTTEQLREEMQIKEQLLEQYKEEQKKLEALNQQAFEAYQKALERTNSNYAEIVTLELDIKDLDWNIKNRTQFDRANEQYEFQREAQSEENNY